LADFAYGIDKKRDAQKEQLDLRKQNPGGRNSLLALPQNLYNSFQSSAVNASTPTLAFNTIRGLSASTSTNTQLESVLIEIAGCLAQTAPSFTTRPSFLPPLLRRGDLSALT
jgi:hypothetical protein